MQPPPPAKPCRTQTFTVRTSTRVGTFAINSCTHHSPCMQTCRTWASRSRRRRKSSTPLCDRRSRSHGCHLLWELHECTELLRRSTAEMQYTCGCREPAVPPETLECADAHPTGLAQLRACLPAPGPTVTAFSMVLKPPWFGELSGGQGSLCVDAQGRLGCPPRRLPSTALTTRLCPGGAVTGTSQPGTNPTPPLHSGTRSTFDTPQQLDGSRPAVQLGRDLWSQEAATACLRPGDWMCFSTLTLARVDVVCC